MIVCGWQTRHIVLAAFVPMITKFLLPAYKYGSTVHFPAMIKKWSCGIRRRWLVSACVYCSERKEVYKVVVQRLARDWTGAILAIPLWAYGLIQLQNLACGKIEWH